MPSQTPTPSVLTLSDVTVFRITIAGITLGLDMSLIALLLLIVIVVLLGAVWYRRTGSERLVVVSVDIPLGGIGRITVNADREVARLAHQAWLEIMTRKAGLPLDEENDVIEEVLNSWYELFRELRTIAKSVPPPSLRTKNARVLVDTLLQALNGGLRPPLTKWQARYRAWYAEERRQAPSEPPQETQRRYPEYQEMLVDLRQVNGELQGFAAALRQIALRAQEDAASSVKEK